MQQKSGKCSKIRQMQQKSGKCSKMQQNQENAANVSDDVHNTINLLHNPKSNMSEDHICKGQGCVVCRRRARDQSFFRQFKTMTDIDKSQIELNITTDSKLRTLVQDFKLKRMDRSAYDKLHLKFVQDWYYYNRRLTSARLNLICT